MTAAKSTDRFGPHVLLLDAAAETARLEAAIREIVGRRLRRRGAVVAVSGGVDSAVCAALVTRALGPERVQALLLPERDSSPRSTSLGRLVCEGLGVAFLIEDITSALEALACYERRDEAIRGLFPEYGPGWKSKIGVAENLLDSDRINHFKLTVQAPDRRVLRERLPVDAYLGIVAATNMKQRTRKLLEYHHAERLNYAVVGTPNRLEYHQGFFVRGGDGLADLKPIAHLFKSQVYQLAAHLDVPEEVRDEPPSTDTYSMPQSQEEFYFALPYDLMDLMLYAYLHDVPAPEAGAAVGLTPRQVERVFHDIEAKKRVADRLHQHAIVAEGAVCR